MLLRSFFYSTPIEETQDSLIYKESLSRRELVYTEESQWIDNIVRLYRDIGIFPYFKTIRDLYERVHSTAHLGNVQQVYPRNPAEQKKRTYSYHSCIEPQNIQLSPYSKLTFARKISGAIFSRKKYQFVGEDNHYSIEFPRHNSDFYWDEEDEVLQEEQNQRGRMSSPARESNSQRQASSPIIPAVRLSVLRLSSLVPIQNFGHNMPTQQESTSSLAPGRVRPLSTPTGERVQTWNETCFIQKVDTPLSEGSIQGPTDSFDSAPATKGDLLTDSLLQAIERCRAEWKGNNPSETS